MMAPGPGGGGGVRRDSRQSRHYAPSHPPQHGQPHAPYPPAMSPYAPNYHPQYYISQYANMGAPAYLAYSPAAAPHNHSHARSPPNTQTYFPMMQPAYTPHSPSSYEASRPHVMPPPVIQNPRTPSSTHSYPITTSMTPPAPPISPAELPPLPTTMAASNQPQIHPSAPHLQPPPADTESAAPSEAHTPTSAVSPNPTHASTETVQLQERSSPGVSLFPWYSNPDERCSFCTSRSRRRKKVLGPGVERVLQQQSTAVDSVDQGENTSSRTVAEPPSLHRNTPTREEQADVSPPKAAKDDTVLRTQQPHISSTQDLASEDAASSLPSATSAQATTSSTAKSLAAPSAAKFPSRPAVPAIPALPKPRPKDGTVKSTEAAPSNQGRDILATASLLKINGVTRIDGEHTHKEAPAPAPAPLKPKLWTGLFTAPVASKTAANSSTASAEAQSENARAPGNANTVGPVGGFARTHANSVAEALQAFRVGSVEKIPYLEPRGLVNTGNMCYMNSVLQVLVFCAPFYDFLDRLSKKGYFRLKSETPLLDAMIMFLREFKVIDAAASPEMLRRRLKAEELEQYGEAFTPEFVYEAIKTSPRFASMERGHQQDAQEFLGFLLEDLHDECAHMMRYLPASGASSGLPSPTSSRTNDGPDASDDWLEVGPRQRPAVTRSSGHSTHASPITKIFGGQLRSELRVPGRKISVTLETYQALQLDIGGHDIRNIVDALKGITRPETLHGDFNSPRGKDVKATKQFFIETLPPVLILHLKRFHFDTEGHGAIKIWKKVGYPLELEIPDEVFSRQTRNTVMANGVPKYRLTTVVYHHGKNASGGHYTVDVLRQDSREWIRIDDTVITRVRSEDVAEAGAEEDRNLVPCPAGSNARRENDGGSGFANNRFSAMEEEKAENHEDDGWKRAPTTGKKWSSIVNGAPSPSLTNGAAKTRQQAKEGLKDNKVAYLLFYSRV